MSTSLRTLTTNFAKLNVLVAGHLFLSAGSLPLLILFLPFCRF